MKLKTVCVLLALMMIVSFAGCASPAQEQPAPTPAEKAAEPAAPAPAAKAEEPAAPAPEPAGPKFPVSKPVAISIIDVAGNAQLSQPALDKFKEAHPEIASDITLAKLTAPELAAKIQSQQQANNIETTLILTGFDGIAACVDQGLLEKLWPTYENEFKDSVNNYLPGAKDAFDVTEGYGITTVFCPGGPMLTYNPDAVKSPIKTPDDLLQWCKEHPNKFLYARPANSGPGRAFLQGLPYILGDSDPKNPDTWDKTWAYLKELDKYIEYYPTGTGITFKELGEGTRDMVASHIGWDMNQRILETIPPDYQGSFFDNQTFVNDAHFACIPKGLSDDQRNASLALIDWLLTPEMQAITYDAGYFYPGPAIKGVTLDMAPADSQASVSAAMRPEYEDAIAKFPNTTQLPPADLVKAYEMWDKLVGAKIQQQ